MKEQEKARIKAIAAEYIAATLAAEAARMEAAQKANAARRRMKDRLNDVWKDSHNDPAGPLAIPESIAVEIDGHTYIVQLDEDLEPHTIHRAEL